jgi:nitrilase
VFNPKGEQIARYDKIHLFDVDVGDAHSRYRESERFAPGTDIVVVDTPFGNVGLSICFDVRFPEHYLALRNAGAEILLVPAAFTYTTGKAHWEVLLRARAIEQQCYVIAANQCGWHDDKRQTWGHSMVIDPWGDVMAQLNDTPGVVVVEIDLKGVAQRRAAMPLR